VLKSSTGPSLYPFVRDVISPDTVYVVAVLVLNVPKLLLDWVFKLPTNEIDLPEGTEIPLLYVDVVSHYNYVHLPLFNE
jgi:hypothetical protein